MLTIRPLRRMAAAAALAVCLAPAAPAPSAADSPVAPPPSPPPPAAAPADGSLFGARALLEAGRFMEALALLKPAVAGEAVDADALFLYGLAALGAAERPGVGEEVRGALLDEAVAAFHAMLVARPGLVRVRIELARAFFLKGEDSLARRHFEQALAGEPPAAVAANIRRFLQLIRSRRRWEAHFGAALAPDSNLNAASGVRTVWIDVGGQRLPFTFRGDRSPKSGLGVSVWGGGEYQYPLAPRWRLRAGADAGIRDYKGGRFDGHYAAAHIGPRRLLDARTEASLLATVRRHWSGGAPETDRYGLRLEAERRLTPRLGLYARLGAVRRNCRDCDWLDGPAIEAALGASWVALPVLRVFGEAGWNRSRAKAEHWRSDGPEASLGASLALPAGFTLGARASMRRTNYRGGGALHLTMDRKPRQDRDRTLSLSVHNRAFTVLGFSPRLSFVNERRRTNAQALAYKRNRAELSFVRQF